MADLNIMYEGVVNSPDTFLTSPLASGGTVMYVADGSVFGAIPNLVVLGSGGNAETVLILAKRTDQGYDIQRAVEGISRDWPQTTVVARNFTNKDYETLINNINLLNDSKVEKVENKSLSTYDYDLEAKTKVDAIPDNPEYTNTEYTAGTNITIAGTTISATDTKYTAGTNVNISAGNVISATDTKYNVVSASANGLMSAAMYNRLYEMKIDKFYTQAQYDALSPMEKTNPDHLINIIEG